MLKILSSICVALYLYLRKCIYSFVSFCSIYICSFVCLHLYLNVSLFMHLYLYLYICICIFALVFVYMYLCICIFMYVSLHMCICASVYLYLFMSIFLSFYLYFRISLSLCNESEMWQCPRLGIGRNFVIVFRFVGRYLLFAFHLAIFKKVKQHCVGVSLTSMWFLLALN